MNLAEQILEQSPLAFFILAESGEILSWKGQALRIYGYEEYEAKGRGVEFLCFPGNFTLLKHPSQSL